MSERKPSEGSLKAARQFLRNVDGEDLPLAGVPLALLLDRFAAKARLEEAKWWADHSQSEDWDERFAKLERDVDALLGSPERREEE